jgi:hypothetical protein
MTADDLNLLEDDIDTINKYTQTLIDASKEVDLEVNVEKTQETHYVSATESSQLMLCKI